MNSPMPRHRRKGRLVLCLVSLPSCSGHPPPSIGNDVMAVVLTAARGMSPNTLCEGPCREIAVDTVVRTRSSLPIGRPFADSTALVMQSTDFQGVWGDSITILPWSAPRVGWEREKPSVSFYVISADSIRQDRRLVGIVAAAAGGLVRTWAISLARDSTKWKLETVRLYYEP